MINTIQPATAILGLAKEAYSRHDHKDSQVMAKQIGNLERCIVGYSKREGFFDNLSGIIYRTWNAVKSIFGQSDWQIAKREFPELAKNYLSHPLAEDFSVSLRNISQIFQKALPFPTEEMTKEQAMFYYILFNMGIEEKELKHSRKQGLECLENLKLTDKHLESILYLLIEANENEGFRDIVNYSPLRELFEDPKDTIDALLLINDLINLPTVDINKITKCKLLKKHSIELIKLFHQCNILKGNQDISNDTPLKSAQVKKGEGLYETLQPIFSEVAGCIGKNTVHLKNLGNRIGSIEKDINQYNETDVEQLR